MHQPMQAIPFKVSGVTKVGVYRIDCLFEAYEGLGPFRSWSAKFREYGVYTIWSLGFL